MSPDSTPSLEQLGNRLTRLKTLAETRHHDRQQAWHRIGELDRFLEVAPKASATLEELSRSMFNDVLDEIEENLSHAVREILGQDRTVTSQRDIRNNRLNVHFQIQNGPDDSYIEDILTGQGGSVANILSVSLRLIALSRLDPEFHRPFLVLDEQDCWLKPELVPGFMKLISLIAQRLGLQVLVISHHPLDLFADAADNILTLEPDKENGALVRSATTKDDD